MFYLERRKAVQLTYFAMMKSTVCATSDQCLTTEAVASGELALRPSMFLHGSAMTISDRVALRVKTFRGLTWEKVHTGKAL